MTDFADVLTPLSARLPLPQPARSRVLLEVSADLEAAYQHYLTRGLSEDEARRRAVEAFDLSDEALTGLVRVHTSSVRRLLDRLSGQARSRWERVVLAVVAATLAVVGGELVVRGGVASAAGPFVWPVFACGLVGTLLGVVKFYQIYVRQDHELRRARWGLDVIAALAAAQVFLGFFGAWFELFLAARLLRSDVGLAGIYLFNWLMRSAALLSVSLMGALLIAILWFTLARRVAAIADAEAMMLLTTRGEKSC